jgi:hypothetical protein
MHDIGQVSMLQYLNFWWITVMIMTIITIDNNTNTITYYNLIMLIL